MVCRALVTSACLYVINGFASRPLPAISRRLPRQFSPTLRTSWWSLPFGRTRNALPEASLTPARAADDPDVWSGLVALETVQVPREIGVALRTMKRPLHPLLRHDGILLFHRRPHPR